jgi:putative glycosyltransferase (TIGR04348 family)
VTANRWARILRDLGHRVTVGQQLRRAGCDLLVAIHARKSHAAVKAFHTRHPDRPIVVLLAGTDLYGDLKKSVAARETLELASLLVVLQPVATSAIPKRLHRKVRVVRQSARRTPGDRRPKANVFEVCVLGHLRPVKDPFRAALAARRLPADSRVRILQIGRPLGDSMEGRAVAEDARSPRYRWLGELPRWKALRLLARSRLLVLTSKMEGGANVVSEAIVAGVPVISSRISGSIGMLGDDYPGYFEVGDTRGLAALLRRAETDGAFLRDLEQRVRRLAPLYRPTKERDAWRAILRELDQARLAK